MALPGAFLENHFAARKLIQRIIAMIGEMGMKARRRLAKLFLLASLSLYPALLIASQDTMQKPKSVASPAITNRKPLQPSAFYPLPLTSVRPKGWLRRQLQIQADGLTGHLNEFWPDVGPKSGWLGGDGESWERGPYYMDGLIPLAYLLGDDRLIAKADKWVEWTLTHPSEDGWIGPKRNQDWWPNMVMLKVLTQYQEATGDPRVVPLMNKYFQYHLDQLTNRPLKDWAVFRWYEELLSVLWLYNRNENPQLLELARGLKRQGFNWKNYFDNFPFTTKTSAEQLGLKPGGLPQKAMSAHGVNNAMALKSSGLVWLISGDTSDRDAVPQMLQQLDTYHGVPNGMFTADEHYAGLDPSQGTELCAVVEAMYSLEQLVAILGTPALADRLERIAFNALPATFSADMWAHQYDQQANQVLCNLYPRQWTTNGPESNIFGLEPNFGCCTANMHQGWPKFAGSLWMATPDQGLVAVAYAPCEVRTTVKGGVHVTLQEETEYPFRGDIRITVNPAVSALFPVQLRIPAWADNAILKLNGQQIQGARPGGFYSLERQWKKGDQITLELPLRLRTSRWYQDSVVIERGPLIFSLKIGEDWQKITKDMSKPAISPASDWEAHSATPWNYGLVLDLKNLEHSLEVAEKSLGEFPFSPGGAPVELKTRGRRIPEWQLVDGSAGPLPKSPVKSGEVQEFLTLIPYGSAKLRITAFPLLAEE
jgi:DUF1680 family protein